MANNVEQNKPLVYVPMAADLVHPGHLNIIKEATKLGGRVMVGLFTDKAIASYKKPPIMNYEARFAVISAIKGVDEVVAQEEKDYAPNLLRYKPKFLVHGSDWRAGALNGPRQKAIELMKSWGGEIIEPEYTKGISSTQLKKAQKTRGILAQERVGSLKKLLEIKPQIRGIEAHSGLCAMIIEDLVCTSSHFTEPREFDCLWLSSLTDSSAKGKPDIEFVDLTSRLNTVSDILESSTKPIIYDGDTGSQIPHFALTCKRLERLGISAVVIEDKIGLKKNSLLEGQKAIHTQDSIENFCEKIKAGKAALLSEDFMIIARIESLILEAGMQDALNRAKAYMRAGADGIMIHSRKKDGAEILEFCEKFRSFAPHTPLMAVPTNYPSLSEQDLQNAGINIVVYANQLLRASYSAMKNTAYSILENARALEADKNYISALELMQLIDDKYGF